MRSESRFSERLAAKTIDIGIDQAVVGPLTLMLGGVGGWVYSSPDATSSLKVAYCIVVLFMVLFWVLCLCLSFAGDRVRLYWWSLGVFSRAGATYRQIHVLYEHISRLRALCWAESSSGNSSTVLFGDVLWWLEHNLNLLYVLYRVRGFELGGNGVGMSDEDMVVCCRKLKNCWVQIDRLLPSEPESTLECVARYSGLSEGTRRIAAGCLRQVRSMRREAQGGA